MAWKPLWGYMGHPRYAGSLISFLCRGEEDVGFKNPHIHSRLRLDRSVDVLAGLLLLTTSIQYFAIDSRRERYKP